MGQRVERPESGHDGRDCSALQGGGPGSKKEVRYSEEQKKVINEPVKLEQNYRNFDYESPWKGTEYIKKQTEKDDKKN